MQIYIFISIAKQTERRIIYNKKVQTHPHLGTLVGTCTWARRIMGLARRCVFILFTVAQSQPLTSTPPPTAPIPGSPCGASRYKDTLIFFFDHPMMFKCFPTKLVVSSYHSTKEETLVRCVRVHAPMRSAEKEPRGTPNRQAAGSWNEPLVKVDDLN